MKAKVNVPSDLSEVTLKQYQEFLKAKEVNNDPYKMQCKVIEIFCNVNEGIVRKMKLSDVEKISIIINKMFEHKTPLIKFFTLNGVEYGFISDLDNISFGEYIDLDNNISDWQNMHLAMNVLFRPIKQRLGKKYIIEEYNLDNKIVIQDMPLSAVMGSIFFFVSFRDRLIKSYDQIFNQTGEKSLDAISNFGRKWGWYQSIYALAGGDVTRFEDITELNVHKCLTMLSFMKEKQELENKQIKNKINKGGINTMQISKVEYIVESVATTNLIDPSFLMEDENFINEARLMIKKYPDIDDVIEHLNKWVNENY